jgi:uncharacterized SAM-binding protein YcdF (DUF218 family)
MFVFLSKFLPLFVYPLGMGVILLALALLLHRRRRLQTGLLLAALLVLLVGSNRWVSYGLARSLEWQYLPMENVPQAEVIVVLGGGTESGQYPRPTAEVNSAGDRVLYAARLYKQGKAPVILLSGGNITWLSGRSTPPPEEMAALMDLMAIPRDDLWLQPGSENTQEDAEFSAQMLKEKGVTRVLLVTSAIHMPRAMALFRHLGVEAIPAPTDFTVTQAGIDNLASLEPQTLLVNLMPNTSSLGLTTNALKEYLGILVYRLRGWL